MKNNQKLFDLAGSFIIAWLLSCSLTLILCDTLMLGASLGPVILVSGLTALLCALINHGRVSALIGICGAAGALIGMHFMGVRPLDALVSLVREVVALFTGGEVMLTEHALTIACLLATVISVIMYLISRLSGGIYPGIMITAAIVLGCWFAEHRLNAVYLLPAMAALAAMFARSHSDEIPYLRALPVAALAAVLALLLVPAGHLTYPPLEQAAEKVRQLFYDYFMFTDPRTSYSVSTDGFQPQTDHLGGPAQPREDEIMMVESDVPLLLRGTIKRTYTGSAWTDSALNNRYLYVDPTKSSIRNRVFGLSLPSDSAIAALREQGLWNMENQDVQITMLNERTSTLFVSERMQDFEAALDLVAYYNNTGELFITRGVQNGDRYRFTAQHLTGGEDEIGAMLAYLETQDDDEYENARANYLNLPQGVEQGVVDLARQVTADGQTPYQKALLLMRELQSGRYDYRLEVNQPPANRDFVSYFLLESREGYCTYYASAMAVMARVLGLPARYVEGYLVQPGPDGSRLVTGKNAHAWVEIYFKGYGWMSFNPTPGNELSDEPQTGDPEEELPASQPTPEPEWSDPELTTPEPEDETEPEAPEETPEPEGDEAEPEDTEESEPTEEPTDAPDDLEEPWPDEEPEPSSSNSWSWLKPLLLVLLVLALISGIVWFCLRRMRMSDPRRMSAEAQDDALRLMIWYRALLLLLSQLGQQPAPGETPLAFAQRMANAGTVTQDFVEISAQVAECSYAGMEPEAQVFQMAQAVYDALARQLKPIERAKWLLHRLRSGLGRVDQIP